MRPWGCRYDHRVPATDTASIEDADFDADLSSPRRSWKDWVGLLARLILGGALLVAGLTKVGSLEQSVDAVRAYQLLPYDLAKYIGYGLPIFEIILGAMIIVGFLTRWTALLGTLLMAAFVFGIASAWARGLTIDCGCFGGGGEVAASQTKYPQEIARDAGFMLAGLWLIIRPRSRFAVDNYLFPDEDFS